MIKNNENRESIEKVKKIRAFYFAVSAIEEYQEELKNCATTAEIVSLSKEKNCDIDGEIFEQGILNAANSLSTYYKYKDCGKNVPIEGVYSPDVKSLTDEDVYREFLERFLGDEYLKLLGVEGIQQPK
jgi:hypothetical protein